jgi:hypothetical protein
MPTLSGEDQAIEKLGIQVIHSVMNLTSWILGRYQRPWEMQMFHPTRLNFKACS